MAFTPEEIEFYHNRGLMPDWIYYQVNGKSAQENYNDYYNKRTLKLNKKYLREDMQKQLDKEIEDVLDNLLKDFNS